MTMLFDSPVLAGAAPFLSESEAFIGFHRPSSNALDENTTE
jgi:hypothetical protein